MTIVTVVKNPFAANKFTKENVAKVKWLIKEDPWIVEN